LINLSDQGSFIEGKEYILNNNYYVYIDSILRQRDLYSVEQEQTKETFGFKWSKRDTYESDRVVLAAKEWLMQKYFDNSEENVKKTIKRGITLLDAGCGSAFSSLSLFGSFINDINYVGIDISNAVDVAKSRFIEKGLRGTFIQANLLELPFETGTFDVIFSEGVLHHTDSTSESIKYLSRFLKEGGYFLFYVYKKKAPIREFSDDYIRNELRGLTQKEAWKALYPLTKFGKVLGDSGLVVEVEEEIPILQIPKGKISVQRLFYYYFFKCYYRENWSIDEMNHVNFDWYMPSNCHRHTPEEIKEFCNRSGLRIQRLFVDDSGISVIAKKTPVD